MKWQQLILAFIATLCLIFAGNALAQTDININNRSLAKVIKIYPFVGNEVRNCRYQQSNSISDQIADGDFCILMKVPEIF